MRPGQRRSDAERSRTTVLDAAGQMLAEGTELDMSRLARKAGMSRSTLYRHFPNAAALGAALDERAVAEAADRIAAMAKEHRAPMAAAHDAVAALVEIGARHGLARLPESAGFEPLTASLVPLLARLWTLAELEPEPPPGLLEAAATHAAAVALRFDQPPEAAPRLLERLVEPLDRGLVVLDPDSGGRLAINPAAAAALGPAGGAAPAVEALYEDGSPCPPDAYPLALAVASGESQAAVVRGHRLPGGVRWFGVEAVALRDYALAGILTDVTDERVAELRQLPPAGSLGQARAATLDVAQVLDRVPARLLPEQLVAEARLAVDALVALYVVDIDGTRLLRLAGGEEFPDRMLAPLALGPELAEDGIPRLRRWLAEEMPGVVMAAMWLRGRAVGVLLAAAGDQAALDAVARQAAPAMELANGYTDVFDAARRRKEINPAAEIQQSLMPPRIVRIAGGELASGVLPSYDVGGDWIDYVDNRDGAWIAIADAAGRGPLAAALGSVGLAALRAARRNGQGLEDAVRTIHETISDAAPEGFFLTALVARWSPVYSSFSWINAGHPPPILVRPGGECEVLRTRPDLPLGLLERERDFTRSYRRLGPADRLVLYTDGITARPTADGFFGIDGIARAVGQAEGTTASAIARSIQQAVVEASERELRDDAAVVVLAPSRHA
jgi:hypothetical protein